MFAEVSQLFHFCFYFQIPPDTFPSVTYLTAVSGIPKEHSSRSGLPGAPLGLGLELNEGDLRYLREAKVGHLKPQFRTIVLNCT